MWGDIFRMLVDHHVILEVEVGRVGCSYFMVGFLQAARWDIISERCHYVLSQIKNKPCSSGCINWNGASCRLLKLINNLGYLIDAFERKGKCVLRAVTNWVTPAYRVESK